MKKTLLSLSLSVLACSGFAGLPMIKQIARYNLGALPSGNVATSVAFDGVNAYVGTSSGGAAGTSVLKIADALTNAGQTPSVFATQPTAAGGSRAADLIYANDSLYYGYGLGDSAGGWGVSKYNLDGSLDAGFGNAGSVKTISTFTAGSGSSVQRIDSLDLDPVTGNLAAVSFGGGFVFEIDALTGATAPRLTFSPAPTSFSWRAISFDGSGNLFARTAGGPDVRGWTRNGSVLENQTQIAKLGTGMSANQRIEAVSGAGFDPFLMANDYNTVGDAGVTLLDPTTGASLGTLTGTEDGLGAAFGNSAGRSLVYGFESATFNGNTYLLVSGISNLGGQNTLAIYQVNPVPEPASLAALGLGALALLRRRTKRNG